MSLEQPDRNSLTQVFPALPESIVNGQEPQLVAISGPRQGLVYRLGSGQTTKVNMTKYAAKPKAEA